MKTQHIKVTTNPTSIAALQAFSVLPRLLVFMAVIGTASLRAQTTPSTTPTIFWQNAISNTSDWFTSANWFSPTPPPRVPTTGDDVNVAVGLFEGQVSPQILGGSAVARTLTLGRFANVGIDSVTMFLPGQLLVGGPTVVGGASGQLTVTPTDATRPGIQILQNSSLSIVDGGVVTLTNQSTIQNFAQINIGTGGLGGTLNAATIQNNGTISTITFNLTDTTTLNAAISDSGSITKLGSGTAILAGDNTYSGGTTVEAGSLVAAASNTLGTNVVAVSNSSSLLRVNAGVSLTNFVEISGASLDNFGTVQASAVTEGPKAVVRVFGLGARITNEQGGTITSPDLIAIQSFGSEGETGSAAITNSGRIFGTIGISLNGGMITNNSTG
jgi:autotransporter-associated beta strand protein